MSGPALLVPGRTITGRGSRAALFGILAGMDGAILLVHGRSARWAEDARARLARSGREVSTVVAEGEPTLPQLERALATLRGKDIGAVVAIGGGSAIDLGKALAALLPATGDPLDHLEVVGKGLPLERSPLPCIALPTTAGTGAEATKNAVIDCPDHARKVSLRDPGMIPRVAILDADLTDGLPWPVTLMTGMDAVTQLIEPFLSRRAIPATDALCRAAIEPALQALLRLAEGEDAQARETLLLAAHMGGIALANAGLGAVHGLAGVVGGRTGAPHGAICARLLPGVLAVNRDACSAAGLPLERFDEVDAMVARAFGRCGTAADLLRDFLGKHDLPPLDGPRQAGWIPDVIASEAMASSSMKANAVDLPQDVLVRLLVEA